MKYRVYILISLIFFLLTACEKGYENEIFDEKYQIIYGTWEYQFTIGDVSLTYKRNLIIQLNLSLMENSDITMRELGK